MKEDAKERNVKMLKRVAREVCASVPPPKVHMDRKKKALDKVAREEMAEELEPIHPSCL